MSDFNPPASERTLRDELIGCCLSGSSVVIIHHALHHKPEDGDLDEILDSACRALLTSAENLVDDYLKKRASAPTITLPATSEKRAKPPVKIHTVERGSLMCEGQNCIVSQEDEFLYEVCVEADRGFYCFHHLPEKYKAMVYSVGGES